MLETIRLVSNDKRFAGGTLSTLCMGPLGALNMMRGAQELLKDCIRDRLDVMAGMETVTGNIGR